MQKKLQNNIIMSVMMILLLAFDQVTKYIFSTTLNIGERIAIIPNILEFTYIQNRGAAFGMLQGGKWIFLSITILFSIILFIEYKQIPNDKKYNLYKIITIFLIAGAIGNAIDRVMFSYVRDFIYISCINFPVFNIADMYVTISMFLLILKVIKTNKKDECYFLNGIEKIIERRFQNDTNKQKE